MGLLAVVLLQLGGVALTTPAAFALAGAAFIAVRWFKVDILWVFVSGLAIWGSPLIHPLAAKPGAAGEAAGAL